MNIKELEKLFKKNIIPPKTKNPITFLGIAKQPHYENVISNIYAFFFDQDQEHGFDDLFIRSLIQCINKRKTGEKIEQSSEYDISTEESTDKKGRIDILLRSEDSAIIIENKIYHHLANGLRDYWNSSTKVFGDTENSIGVILCLFKIKSTNANFIVITHKEFMNQINKNIGDYHINCNPKYLIFLQDFQQNLFNQSKKIMTEEHLEIYLDNQNQIEDAIALKKEYEKKLFEQVNAVEFEEFNQSKFIVRIKDHPSKKSIYYQNVSLFKSVKHEVLRVKISYESLKIKDNCFTIEVDLRPLKDKRLLKKVKKGCKFNHLKPEWSKIEEKVFAIKTYHPSKKEKMNLTQFISHKLVEDGFIEIFNELNNMLTKERP